VHAPALVGEGPAAVVSPAHNGMKSPPPLVPAVPVAAPAVPEPVPAVGAAVPAVPVPVPAVLLPVPAALLPVPAVVVGAVPALVVGSPVGESFEPEHAAALKHAAAAKVSTRMRVVRTIIPRKVDDRA
jgi:hypothetical protein